MAVLASCCILKSLVWLTSCMPDSRVALDIGSKLYNYQKQKEASAEIEPMSRHAVQELVLVVKKSSGTSCLVQALMVQQISHFTLPFFSAGPDRCALRISHSPQNHNDTFDPLLPLVPQFIIHRFQWFASVLQSFSFTGAGARLSLSCHECLPRVACYVSICFGIVFLITLMVQVPLKKVALCTI
ncbi:hypothetical protein MP228_005686 [Amoeboaphelidium protococcarum]|nr:hypothetical protein MP228_005686 [Amoeboaphelidium protococcarum]